MSSVHQQIPWGGHANYAASKGGIKILMESLAQEMAPHRIRVNGIAPGAIRTPINTSAWSTPQAYAELMKLVPMGESANRKTSRVQPCGSLPISPTMSLVRRSASSMVA